VSVPAGVEDAPIKVMGQDEPVAALVSPLDIKIQTQKEEEPEEKATHASASSASAPESLLTEEVPEVSDTQSTAQAVSPPPEPTPTPTPTPVPVPVFDAPVLLPPEADTEAASTQVSGPTDSLMHPDQPEENVPAADPETQLNGPLCNTEPAPATPPPKSKPLPLKIHNTSQDEIAHEDEETEIRPPMGTYKFDPNQLDDSFNPFTSGGSKIQNSPPPCDPAFLPRLEPIGSASEPMVKDTETPPPEETKPVRLEFGLDEGPVTKPPPKKFGKKKTVTKLPGKKARPKVAGGSGKPEPAVSEAVPPPVLEPPPEPAAVDTSTAAPPDPSASVSLDDVPIPKAAYNFDPSQWDDPNFNPFGSNSTVNSSPTPPKVSYKLDPDNCDDSVDPFKPSKGFSNDESTISAPPPEKKVIEEVKEEAVEPRPVEKKARQPLKKNKNKNYYRAYRAIRTIRTSQARKCHFRE